MCWEEEKNPQGVGWLLTYGSLSSHGQSEKENFIIATRKVQSSFSGQGTLGDQGISGAEHSDSASFISVFDLPLVTLLHMTDPRLQYPKFKSCATTIHFCRAPLKQMLYSTAVVHYIQILLEAKQISVAWSLEFPSECYTGKYQNGQWLCWSI